MPRKVAAVFTILGVAILFVGMVIIGERDMLSKALLGANSVFGMPWEQSDAQKVAIVAIVGLTLAVCGFSFALGGGVFWAIGSDNLRTRSSGKDIIGLNTRGFVLFLSLLVLWLLLLFPILIWWLPWVIPTFRSSDSFSDTTNAGIKENQG